MRSSSAGAAPLYGTWTNFTPVLLISISIARCAGVPLPELAKESLPGSRRAASRKFSNDV